MCARKSTQEVEVERERTHKGTENYKKVKKKKKIKTS